ncbi:MrcB family domain-containing protein [Kribbella sp. CA-245084]|uniref:MrcB family domain-containing protein n=1 Tax=Kribbella sp. CA-245084 TaxID=3239940 RepID=UPI003D8D45DA
MELRELIGRIGREYDRRLDFQSPAQQLLRAAGKEIEQWAPVGYVGFGSGGMGTTATIPWIALFDPDETTTAQRGLYVVYLYSADGHRVFLALAQGVTEVTKSLGVKLGREKLYSQAAAIREKVPEALRAGLSHQIDLRSTVPLAVNYATGTVLAREYLTRDLPDEETLVADLRAMVQLYQSGIEIREQLRIAGVDLVVPSSASKKAVNASPEFKPKNDGDYRQEIAARVIVKSRKHETLVKTYGQFLKGRGLVVATNVHPRDMTADRGAHHWLIEAKTVDRGNGVKAARDALGQLLSYRYFLYETPDEIRMLALFNEPIGDACVAMLEHSGVAAVWNFGGTWHGSTTAIKDALC